MADLQERLTPSRRTRRLRVMVSAPFTPSEAAALTAAAFAAGVSRSQFIRSAIAAALAVETEQLLGATAKEEPL